MPRIFTASIFSLGLVSAASAQDIINNGSGIGSSAALPAFVTLSLGGAAVSAGNPLPVTGTVTATSAATYNSTPPTYVSGTSNPLQADVNGRLLTSDSITTWAGGALGAMANYGTSPGAVLVPGVNAYVTTSALPTGAATSTNQEVTLAGTTATSAQGVQGVTGGVAMPTSLATLPALTAGSALIGSVTAVDSNAITNPTSTLTSGTATAITPTNNEIASSTVAASIVVPFFALANSAGGAIIPKLTMQTSATSGWGAAILQVDLWRAAPTLTNGDGAVYLIATGSANYIGSYTCTLAQAGDGAYGECVPVSGNVDMPKLASGTAIYWTLFSQSTVTKVSGQTFILTAEALN
jgi:hypothetical protein